MKRLLLITFALATALAGLAQSSLYERYIDRYKDLAIEQMHLHGIPASITLAQGLLESGAGTSHLARVANNHFGIKTGGTWDGPYVVKDDDRQGERFRQYATVEASYEDHAQFLLTRSRYADLFKLDHKDYKGWAHGLKNAGYATNPEYANKLISLIELYKLHQYDKVKPGKHRRPEKSETSAANVQPAFAEAKPAPLYSQEPQRTSQPAPSAAVVSSVEELRVGFCNETYYVRARANDTFESIAYAAKTKAKKLRQYNEVPDDYQLHEGDIVFLQKKQKHVSRSLRYTYHTVSAGESLHAIAQRYALRLDALYKANNLRADYRPAPGDRLILP